MRRLRLLLVLGRLMERALNDNEEVHLRHEADGTYLRIDGGWLLTEAEVKTVRQTAGWRTD